MSPPSTEGAVTNVSTAAPVQKSGYDLPVYGLHDGSFLKIHIPAMTCISISFICAVIVIFLSFRNRRVRTFFSWTKSERFIIYLAVCDGLFNVAHFTDHMHIAVVRNHVYPKELCEFYGFMLAEFITAQNLMVNIVAINAFLLMYYARNLDFGRWDWKLLVWTFGVPFVGATAAGIAGQLGPNGTFCYFDGVKGVVANICFTTVPLLIILVMNTVLYILTWKRIHDETAQIKHVLGNKSASMRASHRAARAMSLFVAAFFIQWWAMAMFGIWGLAGDVPQTLFHLVTTFSNIGGILNLGVYVILRHKLLLKGETVSSTERNKASRELSRDRHTFNTLQTPDASFSEITDQC